MQENKNVNAPVEANEEEQLIEKDFQSWSTNLDKVLQRC